MNRERLEELVSGHLDGELSPPESQELKELLQSSEEARELLESYRSGSKALGELAQLKAPDMLKARTRKKLTGSARKKKGPVWLWLGLSLAASFTFFALGQYFTPPAQTRFQLTSQGLQAEAGASEVVELPQTGELELLSPTFSGNIVAGTPTLTWQADAGTLEGGNVRARLSLDFDGDQVYDFSEESREFALDSKDGFQTVTSSFGNIPAVGRVDNCRAKIELVGSLPDGAQVSVRLGTAEDSLALPVREFAANS